MIEPTFTNFLYLLIVGYLALFIGVGFTFGRGYMRSNPSEGRNKDGIQRLIDEHGKSETTSLTLAGLALTGLVFVLTLEDAVLSAAIEDLAAFFSIGVILEIASGLLYRHLYRQSYPFLGFVFQYGGLLAIFNGFFAYLTIKFQDSELIWVIYSLGLAMFFILTIKELWLFNEGWQSSKNVEGK